MNSISDCVPWSRVRRLGLGLILLTVSACGLADYEDRMRKSEEREALFREEQLYLDEPILPPTKPGPPDKNKKSLPVAVATVFLRPPKGIDPTKFRPVRPDFVWSYQKNSDSSKASPIFSRVEVAFAKGDKNFSSRVLDTYPGKKSLTRHPSLPFDSCEVLDSQNGYSINIWNGISPQKSQAAVIYVYPKQWRENVKAPIEVSLRTLALDQDVIPARTRYNKKSPWRLSGPLEP